MSSNWEWVEIEQFPVKAKCPLCGEPGSGQQFRNQQGKYIRVYIPVESEVGNLKLQEWICWSCSDFLHTEADGKLVEQVAPYFFFRVTQ